MINNFESCKQFLFDLAVCVYGFRMKQIVTSQTVKIPKEVTVSVKSRLVTVKGPRGVLRRNFKHLALDIRVCFISLNSRYCLFRDFKFLYKDFLLL
jgi:hypothetical protein